MKYFRSTVIALELAVQVSAIYLLICDPRWNSLWAAALMSVPLVLLLIFIAKAIAMAVNDPSILVGASPKETKRLAMELVGPKKETMRLKWACRGAEFVGCAYMIWAGAGLAGCGEAFLALVAMNWALGWLNETRRGRAVAVRLGIPVTPEDETIID